VIEPRVREVLIKAQQVCRQHLPVMAEIWQGTREDAKERWGNGEVEDLSDAGLLRRKEAIAELRCELDNIAALPLSAAGICVVQELRRFAEEQYLRHVEQRILETRAAAYLRLIAFALLPAAIHEQLGEPWDANLLETLKYRAARASEWLSHGDRRILAISENDRNTAAHICRTLSRWTHAALARDLLAGLERWSNAPVQSGQPLVLRLSVNHYLSAVLGLAQSAAEVAERLLSSLSTEVHLLSEAHAASRSAEDGDFAMSLDEIQAALRGVVCKRIGQLSPGSRIIPAPAIIEPFVEDAMFAPGRVVLVRLTNNAERLTRRQGAASAIMLAHELVPGHGEQISRAWTSPIAELYRVTRSPIGFEGWGCFAEWFAAEVKDLAVHARAIMHAHRARRLLASIRIVGGATAKVRAADLVEGLPLDCRRMVDVPHQSDLQMLAYSVGLLETERALDMIGDVTEYLAWGPVAPRNVLRVAGQSAD